MDIFSIQIFNLKKKQNSTKVSILTTLVFLAAFLLFSFGSRSLALACCPEPPESHYTVLFNDRTINEQDDTSTWSYTVLKTGEGPSLSHWVWQPCFSEQELQERFVSATPPADGVGQESSVQHYGVKWEINNNCFVSGTFTVTIKGQPEIDQAGALAAIKAGQCGIQHDDSQPHFDLIIPGPSCAQPPPGPYCGDGNLDCGEECDEGEENATSCTPEYGSSCTYCSLDCEIVEVQGPYCGDGIINGPEECEEDKDCCGLRICHDCICEEKPEPGCVDNDQDGYYAYDEIDCQEGNDCDDTNPNVNPSATEICDNQIDDDCDSLIDNDDPHCFYGTELEMTKSAQDLNGSPLLIGDTVLYTLKVTNIGLYAALNVIVTDNLPTDVVTCQSLSSDYGTTTSCSENPVIWTISSLPTSTTATLLINVSINPGTEGQTATNTGSVIADNAPPVGPLPPVCPDGSPPDVSGNCETTPEEPEPYCGDGNLDPGEECDDGNNEDNDGCSATCKHEGAGPECTDDDGDSYATEGGDCGLVDCDDTDDTIYPGAEDTVDDGIDQNCDGVDGVDEDGDGYANTDSGGTDCDDSNPDVNPGATEICNNQIDDDCDDNIDCEDADCTGDIACIPVGPVFGIGGVGSPPSLIIFDEQSGEPSTSSVTLTWSTNIPATSRVIYDILSHPTLDNPPDYGYSSSTPEYSALVTFHTVTITGLIPCTTYYWRAVSHSYSEEVVGDEMTFTTLCPEEFSLDEIEERLNEIGKAVDVLREEVESLMPPPLPPSPPSPPPPPPPSPPSPVETPEAEVEEEVEEEIIEEEEVGINLEKFLAAIISGFFNLENFCPFSLLLLVILIILCLFFERKMRKEGEKNQRQWIFFLILAILIILYCFICCASCWLLLLLTLIMAIIYFIIRKREERQIRIRF